MRDLRRIKKSLALAALVAMSASLNAGCASLNGKDESDNIDFQSDANERAENGNPGGGSDASLAADTTISDLRYVSRRGGGTVVVESSSPVTFRTRENRELNQFIVDIANAKLPDRLKRPYNTKDFGQAISSVNAYQEPGSSTARVVIQFREPTRATVTQAGKRLLVLAAGPALPIAKGGAERSVDDVSEIDSIAKAASVEGGPGDARILPTSSDSADADRFYGRPISIEVRDMAVRDVINLISEQSGANMVLASGIEGNLTLKLKQIPWDQALMIVLKSQNLGYVRQGNVLRIAPNSALQAEADFAKKIIDAQHAAEPLKVKIIPVSYAKVADMADRVKGILSKDRGSAVPDPRTSSLIITDTPDILERATNLIKALDTPPLQVLIEGKVIEAKEDFSREFGINWDTQGGGTAIGDLTMGRNNLTFNQGLPGTPNALGSFQIGTLNFFGTLEAQLGLAETESKAKVISAPRVVVMNNENAQIEQTLQVLVAGPPTVTSTGALSPSTYTPIDTKLTLLVTPQVTTDGDVMMDVTINRDFLGARPAGGTPDINRRSAKTKVMVRNGQTAVIGGIYQSDMSEGETGIPWIRNIPVLGWLFKNHTTKSAKNELMLFLTPRILTTDKAAPKEDAL